MKRCAAMLAILLAACSGEDGVTDAGSNGKRDAGSPDAQIIWWDDAGQPDSGHPLDGGTGGGVSWCNIQSPHDATIKLGGEVAVFGQVLVDGVTDALGQGAGVVGQLGYGPEGSDPRTASGWIWGAATFNVDSGSNDEYQAKLAPSVAGRYAYAYRFRYGSAREVYCDTEGGSFDPSKIGTLVVKPAGVDWCSLQFPPAATVEDGGSLIAFGRAWVDGMTGEAGQASGLKGQLGYGPQGTDGSTSTQWTWLNAEFNLDVEGNDELKAEVSPPIGSYSYAFRFNLNDGPYLYCDQDGNDGSEGGYAVAQQGELSVVEAKPPAVDWCRLQFPASATLAEGASLPVFGQAFVAGATEAAGAAGGLHGQVGYGPANTDGSTSGAWTWADASFNLNDGSNDELMGTLSQLAIGSYAYAFRFRYQNGDWLYCDLDGNGGGGTYDPAQQGALTVSAAKPPTVDWCRLQIIPGSGEMTAGDTYTIYGQVFVAGVTEPAGAGASVVGELGYGPAGTDGSTDAAWTWAAATYNLDSGNNDEYMAGISPVVGSYSYAYRFKYLDGSWLYCDMDGSDGSAGSYLPEKQGSLEVNPVAQPTIDYCVLQWPPSGTVAEGAPFTAYGQVYKAGVTEPASSGAGIEGQLGYGPANTDGSSASGWTWVPSTFNAQANNNREYLATVSPAAGDYAYAFRFRYQQGTWKFCDLDGSDNGYDAGQQGSLEVDAAAGPWVELEPITGPENVGAWGTIRAEVFVAGVTTVEGLPQGIRAWSGVGPAGTQPSSPDWTWRDAYYMVDMELLGGSPGNDLYAGHVVAPAANGTGWDVAMKFEIDGQTVYADLNGATAYDPAEAGRLVTFEEPEDANNDINWCNVQWPQTLTGDGDVFGQVYVAGVTEHQDGDNRISAMVGWGPDGTDPRNSPWTWFAAPFNVQSGNNDEHVGHLMAPSLPGTYRYVYRFRMSRGWTYCDTDGSSGRTSFDPARSGVLTID